MGDFKLARTEYALTETIRERDSALARVRELEAENERLRKALEQFASHARGTDETNRWSWLSDCFLAAEQARAENVKEGG